MSSLSFIFKTLEPKNIALSWTLAMFTLCLLPHEAVPQVHVRFIDKWVHVLFFLAFNFLWAWAYKRAVLERPLFSCFALMLISAFIGWFIEALQYLLPFLGRSYDLLDVVANCFGGFWGLVLFFGVFARHK